MLSTKSERSTILPRMDKNLVIAKLREHEDELRAAGAEHVSIFGSVARGEATAESDLDLLVKFSEPVIQSGFGYFSALASLQERIAEITGVSRVDIVAEPVRKERLCGETSSRIAPLPTKRPLTRLRDIVENGEAVLEYTRGMDFENFLMNRLVRDASERCLARISEAAVKLGPVAEDLFPRHGWRDIRISAISFGTNMKICWTM